MDDLIAGYRRFRAERSLCLRATHEKLTPDQRPRELVIACCDSHIDPAAIFDAAPGELFVICNVANLAPPFERSEGYHCTSAAIEFAVEVLEVDTILVLGHAPCGGIAAALAHAAGDANSSLDSWVGLLDVAKRRIKDCRGDPAVALEYESIKVTLENLMSFPFVARRIAEGRLNLVGARYAMADGRLELYDRATDAFSPIT